MKRGLVLSGGGKRGSLALAHLQATQRKYTHITGVSTGTLVAIMVASDQIPLALQVYEAMSNERIYSVSPVRNGGKIKKRQALWRLLQGKTSLGELHNLELLIQQCYSADNHALVQQKGIDLTVYAHCIQEKDFPLRAFSTLDPDVDYPTFVKALVASCCFYPLGHLAKIYSKEHHQELEYVDGGHAASITIEQMLDKGVQDIDVYVLNEPIKKGLFPPVKNMIDGVGRVARGMRHYQYWNDLRRACKLAAHGSRADELTIRCHYIPEIISDNAMDFNRAHAQQYAQMGADLPLMQQFTEEF